VTDRRRALVLGLGGLAQVAVGLALLWLLPQTTDDHGVGVWLALDTAWVALGGVLVAAGALRWAGRPTDAGPLPTAALVVAVLGLLVSGLGALFFVVAGGSDAGTAFVLGALVAVAHGTTALLAATLRRESSGGPAGRPV
jgi:hypothetical protein